MTAKASMTVKEDLRIIEDDTFDQAAAILEQRCSAFHINHERQSNRHLFSTLIKCKDCGYSFRRRVRTYKNTYIDWVCSGRNANGTGSCAKPTALTCSPDMDSSRNLGNRARY